MPTLIAATVIVMMSKGIFNNPSNPITDDATNIFGINKNLYNKVISVNFKKFIRPEKKFRNLKHLKQQIKLDIKKAKK